MDDSRSVAMPDRSLVNLSQGSDMRYWTARFGVSRDRLAEAVQAVGHSADAVERYLRG